MSPYTPDQIRAAFNATVEFFRNNPDKHIRQQMSDGTQHSPFDADASCFCFAGRFAAELGPLPRDGQTAGYDECDAIRPGLAGLIYQINDNEELTLEEIIERETKLFTNEGLL